MLDRPAHRDRVLVEQLDYYRARAPEYDEWWLRLGRYDRGREANERWFADQAVLHSAVAAFEPRGNVLELACGTGLWTEKLLPFASRLTVVDGSREMLDVTSRKLSSPKLRLVEANLFAWEPDETFDVVFFSFWLSHVPPDRFEAFWRLVDRCLAPTGRVFFIDSQREPGSTAAGHVLPPAEIPTLWRHLNDGRSFEIYKIFYGARDLENRLQALGWRVAVHATSRYFIYGGGRRRES